MLQIPPENIWIALAVTLAAGLATAIGSLLVLFSRRPSPRLLAFGLALLLFVPGLALSYGPQSAMYAEMFPRSVRFSGVSVGYALGAIIGGAFAPMIAELLLESYGGTWAIGIYLMALCAISLIALAVTPSDLHKREL